MIELILIFILSVSTSFFGYLYMMQKRINIQIMANTLKALMIQQVEHEENKTDKEKINEDFLKFVSDSRDLAYQYIEDVHKNFEDFSAQIEPDINYFDEYGIVGSSYPHYDSMKRISIAYKKLKESFPKESGDS